MPIPNIEPLTTESLDRRTRRVEKLVAKTDAAGNYLTAWRIAAISIFLAGLCAQVFLTWNWAWLPMLTGLAAFAALVQVHDRIKFRKALMEEVIYYHARSRDALRRIIPTQVPREETAYPAAAADLNLTGKKSLSALLDRTTSAAARKKLDDDLVFGAKNPAERRAELLLLARHYGFGAKFIALSRLGRIASLDLASLETWVKTPITFNTSLRWIGLSGMLVFIAGITLDFPPYLGFVAQFALAMLYSKTLRPLYTPLQDADKAVRRLDEMSRAFQRLTPNAGAKPVPMQGMLETAVIRQTQKFVSFANVGGDGLIYALFNALFWYDAWVIDGVKSFQKKYGTALIKLLDDAAYLESLISQSFFYFYPDSTLAQSLSIDAPLQETQGSPATGASAVLQVENLAHPLIDGAVPNSVVMKKGETLIITGSNMSGKSTFLRTVGIALSMHRAGLPVRASSAAFADSVALMSTMAITDDLSEGESFFYAEVKALRAMIDRAGKQPMLCLIDEMLRGTNTRERLIASKSILHALQQRKATVLISTHDIQLSELAGITNYHFNETAGQGALEFDYKLKTGIIESTNALKILESQGITILNDEG